jgi:hypothetical protein
VIDHARFAPVALPLIAGLLAGCQGTEQANNVTTAAAPPPRAPTPAELAQRLVRQKLTGQLSFANEQVFTSAGATIVCGRVAQAGQAAQRFIAVGEEDVFVESQMQPGHMDRAVTEFCRNA